MARKLLNGQELAGFIKQRQAKQVRMLRQAHGILPRLAIIKANTSTEVINTYVRMKQAYGSDILVDVDVYDCEHDELKQTIARLNSDDTVQAIVVQLPLQKPEQTQEIVDAIAPEKDVDGLGVNAEFISATAEAVDWLLSGYSVDLKGKKITLLGRGKLVGGPLEKLWKDQGLDVTVLERFSENIDETLLESDIIVSATGQAGVLHDSNVPHNAVVVDAGTSAEDGVVVGDTDPRLQARQDLVITPPKGGVGPLTVSLMFDHVIRACLAKIPD
jgi:methylenetetrahydrofolate dehydrogenase (NADP+) / methenyltetrahydrofolate cyclohydrolase